MDIKLINERASLNDFFDCSMLYKYIGVSLLTIYFARRLGA